MDSVVKDNMSYVSYANYTITLQSLIFNPCTFDQRNHFFDKLNISIT